MEGYNQQDILQMETVRPRNIKGMATHKAKIKGMFTPGELPLQGNGSAIDGETENRLWASLKLHAPTPQHPHTHIEIYPIPTTNTNRGLH